MPIRESHASRGEHRARVLRHRLAEQFVGARQSAAISRRELERSIGVSREVIRRIEHGAPGSMTIDNLALVAAGLGQQLAVSLYPDGDPVRDRGHLALLERLRARLGPGVRWQSEVPVPIAGDRRSADAVITFASGATVVEAETHLHDIQALERRIRAKARDLGIERVILLVADTRHNRYVISLHSELGASFPLATRACLRALGGGQRPGVDALVIL